MSLSSSYTGEVITTHSLEKNKTLDRFIVTNIGVRYCFKELPITLTGKIKNLLNKNYTTYENYPNPGRELLLTINFTIN
jgi:outer membrane cobalamin receptor